MRRFGSVTGAVAWRSVHNAFSSPALLLPPIVFPLFFIIALAGGLSRIAQVPSFHYRSGYTAFQFAYVFLQSSAFGGVFTGFSIAHDFDTGFTRRLLLSAPRRSGIIAGYVLGGLARWFVIAAIVTLEAIVGGMRVNGDGVQLGGLLALGILTNLAAALWACGVAMFLRTDRAGALIQMPVFIVLFLAPVYVPLNLLTGWIHTAARLNPATAVIEAGRGLLAGSPVKVALAFALLAGGIALLAAWARGGLASAERAG